jgi:hypothetical protein
MRLVRPQVMLTFDEQGALTVPAATALPVEAGSIEIGDFEVVEGRITIDDMRRDGDVVLAPVNLTGSAGSLLGPYRVDGLVYRDGVPHTVKLTTGRRDDQGLLALKL